MEPTRPKFKQKLRTPQVYYAWRCLDCKASDFGRAPGRCPKCNSPMTKEIKKIADEEVQL